MTVKEEINSQRLFVENKLGKGVAFGTFGELLQGVLPNKEMDFLVTLPISCFSHAYFTTGADLIDLSITPASKLKALKLANMILDHFSLPKSGRIMIQNDIPEGKGMASSSADLVAVGRAISKYYDISLPTPLLEKFMQEIEPTDGVMYPGVVSFFHKKVQLCEFLGVLPSLTIVGTDEGGEVDTIEFNKIPKPFTMAEKEELLNIISKAIHNQDVKKIGEVATRSAILNQKLRPKKSLNEMLKICKEVNGLGVVVAHSGTCLGIILSPYDTEYETQLNKATDRIEKLSNYVSIYHSWNHIND